MDSDESNSCGLFSQGQQSRIKQCGIAATATAPSLQRVPMQQLMCTKSTAEPAECHFLARVTGCEVQLISASASWQASRAQAD